MFKFRIHSYLAVVSIGLMIEGCKVPSAIQKNDTKAIPTSFDGNTDSTNTSTVHWRNFFTDPNLINLIDTALKNNQELMITLQEVQIAKSDIRFRNGALLPTIGLKAGSGVEKVGKYTSQGAGDASAEITPGQIVPEVLQDHTIAAYANWEVDIWGKLHNAKKASVKRYLSTIEGKNFVLTNLIAEVANSYYELLALDNQLAIVRQNIELQKNALEIVKIQKEAARATELAVQKFQAEVLNTQSMEFDILQQIKETENKINFLLARYPQEIPRSQTSFFSMLPPAVNSGIPSQLLANRPDIKQAELELAATKLDVKVARKEFYPSLGISASYGYQAFKTSYLFMSPESMLFNLAGDMVAPLINRNAIKAEFYKANSRQVQAMYNYERVILNAYLEVSNQLSKINNLSKSYDLKSKQVDALTRSIDISNDLFKSARADYLEVLMTQRDALEAKLELVETQKNQLNAVTNIYRSLGGGWR